MAVESNSVGGDAAVESQTPEKKKKFTRREWLTLYVLGSVNLASAICISVQGPFYPAEAERKGASSTVYGLVFGIFEIVSFITCPIFGKYINVIGAKFTLNAGIITAALCCIMFGFLDLVDSLPAFEALSFSVRIVEALGAAAAFTAAFAITATVFKDSIGTTFATLEVFYGVGYIVGPTVGGFAYSIGGFKFPFIVTGSFLAIIGVTIYFTLPTPESTVDHPNANLMSLVAVPAVLLNILAVMVTSSSTGYYAAILEPHLRDFNLSPIQIGLMFIISGTMYAVHAPLIGWLCDHGIKPKHCCAIGDALIILGCCLIGPAPFIPSPTILWMCILGLMMHGLGVACVLVSCFIDSVKSAIQHGFSDDLCTYALVSGLWASAFSLGAFLGPSAAGILFDWVGFRLGSVFIISTQSAMLIAVLCFICFERRSASEKKQLMHLANNQIIHSENIATKQEAEIKYPPPNQHCSYGSFSTTVKFIEVPAS